MKKVTKKVVKAWAWVSTERDSHEIMGVEETERQMRKCVKEFLSHPNSDVTKNLKRIYSKSRVVPVTITYSLPKQ